MPHHLHAAKELRRSAIELDLAAQVVREQNAVAARDELVAVVSHDLRNPLSAVSLGATLLVRALVNARQARRDDRARAVQRDPLAMSCRFIV